jgi:DNA-binding transcriptional regulator/RsmH inhibitor MraZ
VIGLGEKIEIWAKPLWEKYEKTQRTAFARHASSLEI